MRGLPILSVRSAAVSRGNAFIDAFGRSWRNHRRLHAFSAFSLLLAIVVGAMTGNTPDFDAIAEFGRWLGLALMIFVYALAIGRFIQLAVLERNPSPATAFLKPLAKAFTDEKRIADVANGLLALFVFIFAFGVLKGAIAILAPFRWDLALSEIGRVLGAGSAPYERLMWLARSPVIVFLFNLAYNCWFFILIVTCFAAATESRDSAARHQFIGAFMLVWLIGGFFMAMAFSSAGPCYFADIGLGNAYQPLMDTLRSDSARYPVWALSTQDMLWEGYKGMRAGSAGISAFPSMHVATAVLYALYWTRRSRAVGMAFWVFAAIIYVGSIVLGWHYAVDGIGGLIVALLMWKLAGIFFGRHAAESMRA